MPWNSPQSVPFTRIGIVSQVPSESGVFGLQADHSFLLFAESWNLKARLLDLIDTLNVPSELIVVYELCPEDKAEARCDELRREFLGRPEPVSDDGKRLPGISFWSAPDIADGREL